MKLVLFSLLFFAVSLVKAELWCYDCDPTSDGECIDPPGNNAKVTLCDHTSSNIQKLRSTLPPKNSCFTINYKPNNGGGGGGIYRGCISYPGNEVACENIKKMLTKGEVTSCKHCDTNSCNGEGVNVVEDI